MGSKFLLTIWPRFRCAVRFDPGWAELRGSAVTMVAVLAAYGSAWALKSTADLYLDVVIQAVVLAWTAAWVQRRADARMLAATIVMLPAVAVGGVGLAVLMSEHPNAGDALFVGCFFLSIWVRRFGALATRAGTLAVLPLIATLVMQGPVVPPFDDEHTLWVALVALITAGWVVVVNALAVRLRLVDGPPTARPHDAAVRTAPEPVRPTASGRGTAGSASAGSASAGSASAGSASAGSASATSSPGPRRFRISVSTRMAWQMAIALGAAFAIGREAYPDHWAWVVLTAFIVGSGARSRGDVPHRGLLRTLGAAVGTVTATWIAHALGRDDARSVILIFVLLAIATWLRSLNYAYWAGCVTAVLSLLYGYLGEDAPSLLRTRLEAIVVGAAIGIVVAWLVLPVRAETVVRRRTAEALAALDALLAEPRWEPMALERRRLLFEHAVRQLGQATQPLVALRKATGWWRRTPFRTSSVVDAWDVVRKLVVPARVLVRCAAAAPGLEAAPQVAALVPAVRANITAVRLIIARRPSPGYWSPAVAIALVRSELDRDGAVADGAIAGRYGRDGAGAGGAEDAARPVSGRSGGGGGGGIDEGRGRGTVARDRVARAPARAVAVLVEVDSVVARVADVFQATAPTVDYRPSTAVPYRSGPRARRPANSPLPARTYRAEEDAAGV